MNVTDCIVRWVLLSGAFLLLSSFFRENVTLEGAAGYIFSLFLVLPINVALVTLGRWELPFRLGYHPLGLYLSLVALNAILFLALTKALPGLSVASNKMLVLFVLIFSGLVFALQYVPGMPALIPADYQFDDMF